MNRIDIRLKELKNKKALITYMTAGIPSMEETGKIIKLQMEAGVDVVELGIPFSDPIADGPFIQASSFKSIQKGTNLKKVFDIVKDVRRDCQVPIVFMLYYNTVLHYGVENFVDKCIECGVDGIIVPDLPYEETFEISAVINNKENAPYLIPLVSPISKDRISMIAKNAKGFIYCVSSMGVTGQNADFYKNTKNYLENVKKAASVPIMLGFGIRTEEDVKDYKDVIDGCIVGTHFMEIMENSNYNSDAIRDYITTFKRNLNC